MFKPSRILHPTDYSEHSNYALHIATDLARQHAASILVLHTVSSLSPSAVSYGEVATELEPEGYRQRIVQNLRRSVPTPEGIRFEYLVAEGDPVEQIVEVARNRSCDLIVMGTHGRTGLQHLLIGSVAEGVVRLAPCPVLTARLPNRGPE
jgi:nucleotide-binding universal stress UspA family protein